MKLEYQFVGQNLELTEALKNYARKRTGKLLKYLRPDENLELHCRVKMEVKGERQKVDLQLTGLGDFIEGEAQSPDMYASIDKAVDRLSRQLRRFHDRQTDHRKKDLNGPNREMATKVFSLDESEEEADSKIIRRQILTAKPMSVEEAVLQMKSLDYNFFVFTDQVTDEVSVVYRRNDGNYGVIETGN